MYIWKESPSDSPLVVAWAVLVAAYAGNHLKDATTAQPIYSRPWAVSVQMIYLRTVG